MPEPAHDPQQLSAPDDAGGRSAQRRATVRNSLGVGVAVGVYGVAFGAASVAAGFSPAQTSVSSLLTFTGGSQFAIAGVVAGGGTALAALGSGYLLGARNTLYGLRMSALLEVRGWLRPLAALLTIDESTAMALAQRDRALSRVAFWWTAGCIYLLWNLSTLAGAVGARALGDPRRFGLDAAIPAAFLALLLPQLKRPAPAPGNSGGSGSELDSAQQRLQIGRLSPPRAVSESVPVAIFAAVIAAVLIPLTPPGVPVLAAGAALVLVLVRNRASGRCS